MKPDEADFTEMELLGAFLGAYPVVHAVPRALEARLLRQTELISPSLDLGCGNGSFAAIAYDGHAKIDVGLDVSPREVLLANKEGSYRSVCLADISALPFVDGSFATIISNSVLEHVQDLDGALPEIARVLAKDGVLLATVPLNSGSEYLFYPQVLRKLGLRRLAEGYSAVKHRIWKHYNLMGLEEWISKLNGAGLEVIEWETFNNEASARVCDLVSPLGLPWFLTSRLSAREWVFRPRWILPLLIRLFGPYFRSDGPPGSGLFFRAARRTGGL